MSALELAQHRFEKARLAYMDAANTFKEDRADYTPIEAEFCDAARALSIEEARNRSELRAAMRRIEAQFLETHGVPLEWDEYGREMLKEPLDEIENPADELSAELARLKKLAANWFLTGLAVGLLIATAIFVGCYLTHP